MSATRWRLLALACAAAAWSVLPANARPPVGRLFLPSVGFAGDLPLPCAPVAGATCGGAPRWHLVCGGFGTLSDLFAEPGTAAAVGIGDGVARLRIATTAGERPMPGQWAFRGQIQTAVPDYDRVLTGLHGIGINACRTGEPGCAAGALWGVGDRPWVARYDGSCWRPDTPLLLANGQPAREGTARLASLVPTLGGGLVVGERDGGATHAEHITRPTGEQAWLLARDGAGAGIPPLNDVDVLGGPFDSEAWAVGRDGAVARMMLSEGTWRRAAQLQGGSAREITMLSGVEGWAFGMAGEGEARATIVWRYDGTDWREEARYPGQALIDAYKEGPDSILLGLTPGAQGVPVLHLRTAADGWRALAGAPPDGDGRAGDARAGNRAIAPLADGRVLYASGADIWLFDAIAGWARLRRRLDLLSIAPDGARVWVLAATATGSRVLRADAGGRLVDPEGDAADLPPLRALAGGGGLWAVGDKGATWRRAEARGAWQQMAPAGSLDIDLLAAARDDAGGLWAAGGGGGSGRLLRWATDSARWQPIATADAPLVAVAELAGGGAVAVGGRQIIVVQPAARCAGGGAATVIVDGQRWCVAVLTPCFADTCLDGLATVGTAPNALWVANGTYVLRHLSGGAPSNWREADWAPSIPAVQGVDKPFEAPITALAVVGPADGWAVFGCCRRRDAPGHETSYAVRFEGSRWKEAVAISVPVRDAAMAPGADGPMLWLAGDWSTLVTRTAR